MRKNVFLFAVLGLFVGTCNSSYAADADSLDAWLVGITAQYKCPELDTNNPLYTGGACVEGCNKDPQKVSAMFAVGKNVGGAKFCVRGVEAWRNKKRDAPTFKIYESNNDLNECVWLCYNGYTGPQCQNKIKDLNDTNKTCDPTELTPRKGPASTASVSVGETVEGHVQLLNREWKGCDKNDKHFGHKTADGDDSNHTMLLAITKYDEGKHGAWVQDILAYSWCKNNSAGYCRTVISKNTKDPILMCKDGYQQSTDGKTCVPIDSYVCDNIAKCDGWPLSDSDDLERVVVEVDGKSCYQHRCKGLNKGFENKSPVSEQTKCIDCVAGEGQDAHVVEDGRCVFTSKGVDPDFDPVGKPACNGWDANKYTGDDTGKKAAYKTTEEYEPYVIDNNGVMCLQYRCAKGYAYSNDDQTECTSCTGDNQMPDQDGVCITVPGNPADCSGWSDIDKKSYTKIYDETNNCYTYLCKEKGYAFKSSDDKSCTPCKGTVQPDGTCKKEFEESNKSDIANAKETSTGLPCWQVCETAECFKTCIKTGKKN